MVETEVYYQDKDANLELLRNKIDHCDQQIVKLLARRFKLVKQIGNYKTKHNQPILDTKREKEIIFTRQEQAFGLKSELVERIFNIIFDESHRIQSDLR
ncbi:chorismate mutase [Chloroflexota bacterium]